MTIASTIYQQLGGQRFSVMTGAKDLLDGGNTLQFKLPGNFARQKITVVRITLTPLDLYDMEFGKFFRGNYKVVERYVDVYNDQLQEVFKRVTGLDTHL